ncbi:MAG: ferredoxin family protein [Catenulispora sp.]
MSDERTEILCRSKAEAGSVLPVVDRNRCEGERDCFDVCPYDVFQVRVLTAEEREGMSFVGHVKSFFHGYNQAIVAQPQDCHACGLCVKACPEKAITLRKV